MLEELRENVDDNIRYMQSLWRELVNFLGLIIHYMKAVFDTDPKVHRLKNQALKVGLECMWLRIRICLLGAAQLMLNVVVFGTYALMIPVLHAMVCPSHMGQRLEHYEQLRRSMHLHLFEVLVPESED